MATATEQSTGIGESVLRKEDAPLISGQGPTAQTALNCPTFLALAPASPGPNGQYSGSGCVYPHAVQTLGDQLLAKGLPWRVYAEDMAKGRTYTEDAFHLLTNKDLCMKCHQVGNLPIQGPVGPPLALAPERLRPDWMQRWIASPQRMLVFPIGQHPMPQMFEATNPRFKDLFDGLSSQKLAEAQKHLQDAVARVKAARDAEAKETEADKKRAADQARRQAETLGCYCH